MPLRWSTNENVRWHVPLPERGNSTPVVWGKRVFVTQAIENENRRTVMCFDRRDGKLLWQAGPTWTEKEPTYPENPPCTPSPVSDGNESSRGLDRRECIATTSTARIVASRSWAGNRISGVTLHRRCFTVIFVS